MPAEENDEADALSRLEAEPKREFPSEALQSSTFVAPPPQNESLWKVRLVLQMRSSLAVAMCIDRVAGDAQIPARRHYERVK